MSNQSAARARAARIHLARLGGHTNQLFEHWNRTLTSLQGYSNELTAVASETLSSAQPNLTSYIADSLNVAITFYGGLCQSWAELATSCLSQDSSAGGAGPLFTLDQYSESADAQPVRIGPGVSAPTLVPQDLVSQAPSATTVGFVPLGRRIPASHVRITQVANAPGYIFISLTDLQSLLTPGPNQIPEGLYTGAVVDTTNTAVAVVSAFFANVPC